MHTYSILVVDAWSDVRVANGVLRTPNGPVYAAEMGAARLFPGLVPDSVAHETGEGTAEMAGRLDGRRVRVSAHRI